jgi:hypothetical protein
MMPDACDIEIVEPVPTGYRASGGGSVVLPKEIRINGTPVLAPANDPVILHEIEIGSGDVVKVTLTLYARTVRVGHEEVSDSGDSRAE